MASVNAQLKMVTLPRHIINPYLQLFMTYNSILIIYTSISLLY